MKKNVLYFGTLLFISIICLSGCKKEDKEKEPANIVGELDGTWTTTNYWTMIIFGNQGFFVKPAYTNQFDGLLKENDPVIRNLQKLDDNIWKGEEIVYKRDLSALVWIPAIYKLNVARNELVSFSEDYETIFYYKIDDSSNNVPMSIKTQNREFTRQ